MKIVAANGKSYRLSGSLNAFQQELYIHLINWKWRYITTAPGYNLGKEYDAILPDGLISADWSSPLIYPDAMPVLLAHLKKNPFRIHKHYYHMASSQAANFNLFLPVLHSTDANAVLSKLKSDFASLATDYLDNGYCMEYWGGNFDNGSSTGLLGDKSKTAGTDTDIAIAYYNHQGELCLWLIEHKLTENEFSVCGAYKSKSRKAKHDCGKSYSEILKDKNCCYYHDMRKFNYWNITDANQAFFANHAYHSSCPFRGGMNQLWRNQLLALATEQSENAPYQQVYFSVVKHPANTSLDTTINTYKKLTANNPKFSTFTSADVISAAEQTDTPQLNDWAKWYRELYNI
ncbi:MAG: hypothetical protein WCO98_17395 [bacterium]